jgi:IS5 family transposase
LDALFKWPLHQASTVLGYKQRQRGRKIWSLDAPEAECIGKGKAHAPYEFGVKVSVATTLKRSKGGQFALHANAASPGHHAPNAPPLRHRTRGRPHQGERRMDRNCLAGKQRDAVDAILAAAGYNFSLILRWLKALLCLLIAALQSQPRQIEA